MWDYWEMGVDRRRESSRAENRALQVIEVRKMNTDRQSLWKGVLVSKRGRKPTLFSALEAK